MRRKIRTGIASAASAWAVGLALAVLAGSARPAAQNTRWGAGYFPNVTLVTQDGAPVRFYDDLLKGKIVAINLIYTTCQYACPLETARMAQVQRLLGDRVGRDVFFYSITIDPEHDTPAVLKAYAEKFQAGPGWLFLTGKKADIDLISRKIGLYSEPDPNDKDGHTPSLLVGNEATGQWMRNSATDNAKFLARTIGDWLNSWQTARRALRSYADAPKLNLKRGQYTFTSHCAACHTIGKGRHIGPDLAGVTARRDRSWLRRFIVAPEEVLAAGDPVAASLRQQYKEVRMPNLGLAEADVDAVLSYIEEEGRATTPAPTPTPTRTATTAPLPAAPATPIDLTAIVGPYLRIQRALNADTLDGVEREGRALAAAAAKHGPGAEPVRAAAAGFAGVAGLDAARAVFWKVSVAVITLATAPGARVGDGIAVAYCPMARKSWLQTGREIRNPYYGRSMSDCGRIAQEPPIVAGSRPAPGDPRTSQPPRAAHRRPPG